MGKVFAVLGKTLVKAGVWCFQHPDEAIAIVNAVKDAKKK